MACGINHPKTLLRLWAGLHSDFESLMAKYMRGSHSEYIHFAKVCRDHQITLVMHVTQGKGKTKDEHYDKITNIILQMCREIWLYSGEILSETILTAGDDAIIDRNMELKRCLGGFYLAYTLFEKQPISDRVKIMLGMDDLKRFNRFMEVIKELPFAKEVLFMIQYLTLKKAFSYSVHSHDFGLDAPTRYFLDSSQNEVVGLTRRMRECQDVLAYSSVHQKCEASLAKMGSAKDGFAKDLLRTVQPSVLHHHLSENSAFGMFTTTFPTESIQSAVTALNDMVDRPISSLQTLTATEAIERRMIMETRIRMQRARKKVIQGLDRTDGVQKVVNPYVREGGIFGRKKEGNEEEKTLHVKRRERGACNGNLWTFISGWDFDKPMGKKAPPPVPTAVTPSSSQAFKAEGSKIQNKVI